MDLFVFLRNHAFFSEDRIIVCSEGNTIAEVNFNATEDTRFIRLSPSLRHMMANKYTVEEEITLETWDAIEAQALRMRAASTHDSYFRLEGPDNTSNALVDVLKECM